MRGGRIGINVIAGSQPQSYPLAKSQEMFDVVPELI